MNDPSASNRYALLQLVVESSAEAVARGREQTRVDEDRFQWRTDGRQAVPGATEVYCLPMAASWTVNSGAPIQRKAGWRQQRLQQAVGSAMRPGARLSDRGPYRSWGPPSQKAQVALRT